MSKLLGDWPGVLAEDKVSHDSDLFKYCAERNAALWAFVRATVPEANGNLNHWVDKAVEKADENRNEIVRLRAELSKILYMTTDEPAAMMLDKGQFADMQLGTCIRIAARALAPREDK